MFKEKNLIFQRRKSSPEISEAEIGEAGNVDEIRTVLLTGRETRKESMPITPSRAIAYKMIDDVFGKANREKIIKSIDPQSLQAAIEDLSMNFLMPPHNLKYKGTFQEFGKIWLTFDDNGKELKYKFTTLFYLTDEKMKELLAMTKTPPLNMRALERRADIYIMGRVIEMILNYGPDSMPDDILDRILKTDLIPKIRRVLIEAYKRGREYKMTTSENGFTLETDDPKDPGLPDKIYDMEKFWRGLKLNDEHGVDKETVIDYWKEAVDKEKVIDYWKEAIIGESTEERAADSYLQDRALSEAEFAIADAKSMIGEGTFDDLSDKEQKEIFDNLNIAADNLVEQFPKLRELDDIVQEMQNDRKNIALRERGRRKYVELLFNGTAKETKAYLRYGDIVEGLLDD